MDNDAEDAINDDTEGPTPVDVATESDAVNDTPADVGLGFDIAGSIVKIEGTLRDLNQRITALDRDFKTSAPAPIPTPAPTPKPLTISDLFE